MRKNALIILLTIFSSVFAQNIELKNGKDIRQPGKINPALAGVQEDLIRILTDADIGESYQLMLEGRIPFKLGNYMIGVERTFTDDVTNDMFNITYGRKTKGEKALQWRYGASLKFNSKSLTIPGYDSSAGGYTFKDINGQIKTVKNISELKSSIDYFDLQLGASINVKNLLVGLSIENLTGSNISLSNIETRTIPFTANLLVGGFLNFGENITLFPSAVFVANEEDYYGKASIDFSAKKFNVAAAYISENDNQEISASIAIKVKKVFAGIKYVHPLSDNISINTTPSFNLFLNSTIFKSRNIFKSDFAKQMKKIY